MESLIIDRIVNLILYTQACLFINYTWIGQTQSFRHDPLLKTDIDFERNVASVRNLIRCFTLTSLKKKKNERSALQHFRVVRSVRSNLQIGSARKTCSLFAVFLSPFRLSALAEMKITPISPRCKSSLAESPDIVLSCGRASRVVAIETCADIKKTNTRDGATISTVHGENFRP